ncbi:asparaginase [Tabrizicola aquatica]|uniref:asparaginase n=1 Tax=Tabrizicola aquatica TaxID=909926 RepID=UPI000CD13B54|nr:asparaginase [Tabrizicola aquatica]
MSAAYPMVELWRGGLLESTHAGHAVIWGPDGIETAWGDPSTVIFPRSSCKMIQALPLVETGAADAVGLTPAHLAFACASHQGEARHVRMAGDWLSTIGLAEPDLRCGAHEPYDRDERNRLIKTDESPCQLHNNCSGKHCGFLTVTRHLGAGPEYVEIDHPLQRAIRQATEEVTGETAAGYGIDGCSAPNFAVTVAGLARAMQAFAAAREDGDARSRAMHRLTHAMATHPELVAGEGRACTELMRAMGHTVAKTGAEAVFVAILPKQKRGIALKIVDGGTRGSEAAITALLVRAGVLDPAHPAAQKRLGGVQRNWRGLETGTIRVAPGFPR